MIERHPPAVRKEREHVGNDVVVLREVLLLGSARRVHHDQPRPDSAASLASDGRATRSHH